MAPGGEFPAWASPVSAEDKPVGTASRDPLEWAGRPRLAGVLPVTETACSQAQLAQGRLDHSAHGGHPAGRSGGGCLRSPWHHHRSRNGTMPGVWAMQNQNLDGVIAGLEAADLVLMPVKPGPLDVWAVSDIVDAVKARQETAAGLPKAAFVITMSKTRSRLSQQIEAALDEYGLPVLQARTTDRVAYPQAVIEGKSVLEGRDRTARNEIFALRDEIERLFDDP